MYNKRKFNKINDKKVLHKVKKQWVTISLALLMMIGGGAVISSNHIEVSANNKPERSKINVVDTTVKEATALHNRLLSSAGSTLLKQDNKSNTMRTSSSTNTNNIHNKQLNQQSMTKTDSQYVHPKQNLSSVEPQLRSTSTWDNNTVKYWSNDVMELTGSNNINFADMPNSLPFNKRNNDWTFKLNNNNITGKASDISSKLHRFANLDLTNAKMNISKNSDSDVSLNNVFASDSNLQHVDMSGTNLGNVDNLNHMFANDKNLQSVKLNNVVADKAIQLDHMFASDSALHTVDLTNLKAQQSDNYSDNSSDMFANDGNLTLSDININGLNITDMANMFTHMPNLINVNLSGVNLNNAKHMGHMFASDQNLRNVNISGMTANQVIQMDHMFASDQNLQSANLSNVNVNHARELDHMFTNDPKLASVNLSNLRAQQSDDYSDNSSDMFANDGNLTLSDININGLNITDMANMFTHMPSITTVNLSGNTLDNTKHMGHMFASDQNLQNVNISGMTANQVIQMDHMFASDQNLQSADLNNVNVSHARELDHMFANDPKLTSVSLSNLKAQQDNDYSDNSSDMFSDDSNIQDININGINITDMNNMLAHIPNVTSFDFSGLNLNNVNNMNHMFASDKNLQSVNLNGMNASKAIQIDHMFANDPKLTSVNLGNFKAQQSDNYSDNSSDMFSDDSNLKNVNINGMNIRQMSGMFKNDPNMHNLNLSGMNLKNITSMSHMFASDKNLQSVNLSNTDLSNVSDISYAFANDPNLTSINLTGAKLGNVKNMDHTFASDSDLTNITLTGTNISKVSDMNSTFANDSDLQSLDVSPINTSNVTNMSDMFASDSNLTNLNSSNLNFSNASDTLRMFASDHSLSDIDLSHADASGHEIGNVGGMFADDTDLQNINLKGFNRSQWGDIGGMFAGDTSLQNLDLSNIDFSQAYDMSGMFADDTSLQNLNLHGFGATNIQDMNNVFNNDSSLVNLDLSDMDTSGVNNMTGMFAYDTSLRHLNLGGRFNTNSVSDNNMYNMFAGDNNLKQLTLGPNVKLNKPSQNWSAPFFNNNVNSNGQNSTSSIKNGTQPAGIYSSRLSEKINWKGATIQFTSDNHEGEQSGDVMEVLNGNISSDFSSDLNLPFDSDSTNWHLKIDNGVTSANNIKFSSISDFSSNNSDTKPLLWSNFSSMDLSHLNTSNFTDMSNMFNDDPNLKFINMNGCNTSKVTNMAHMFQSDNALQSMNLDGIDTSNVTDMNNMFNSDNSIQHMNLDGFNTSNVTNMSGMFANDTNLKDIIVNSFNTSKVTNMSKMFNSDTSVRDLNISNFDTNNVTNMSDMFNNNSKLNTLDISNFNTSKVLNMNNMFNADNHLESIYLGSDTNLDKNNQTWSSSFFNSDIYDNSQSDKSSDILNGTQKRGIYSVSPQNDLINLNGVNIRYTSDGNESDTMDILSGNLNNNTMENITLPFDSDVSKWHLVINPNVKVTSHAINFSSNPIWKHFEAFNLTNLDTSNVSDMSFMFQSDTNASDINLGDINTNNVTNMDDMFNNDSNLSDLNLGNINTDKVTNMNNMFNGDNNLYRLTINSNTKLNKAYQNWNSPFFSNDIINISNGQNASKNIKDGNQSSGIYVSYPNNKDNVVSDNNKVIDLNDYINSDISGVNTTSTSNASSQIAANKNIFSNASESINNDLQNNNVNNANELYSRASSAEENISDITANYSTDMNLYMNKARFYSNDSDIKSDSSVSNYVTSNINNIANASNSIQQLLSNGFISNNNLNNMNISNTLVTIRNNMSKASSAEHNIYLKAIGYMPSNKGFINIKYVTSNGNQISYNSINGILNSTFNLNDYKDDIPTNYHFDKVLQGNNVTKFMNNPQDVVIEVDKDTQPSISEGTININYVDSSNNTVGQGISLTENNGQPFDISIYENDVPTNYHFNKILQGSNVTKFNNGTQNIVIEVDKDTQPSISEGTINISYVNDNHNTVGKNISLIGNNGQLFNISTYENDVPTNYHFDKVLQGDNVTKFNNGTQNIIIEVVKDKIPSPVAPTPNLQPSVISPIVMPSDNSQYTINIHYINKDKQISEINVPVSDNNTFNLSDYTTSLNIPFGYKFNKVSNVIENHNEKDIYIDIVNDNKHILTIRNIDKLNVGNTAYYKHNIITRLATNTHYRYFYIKKVLRLHHDILFNKDHHSNVQKPYSITAKINKIFMIHGRKSNYIRYELQIHGHKYFVTGNRNYVGNAYLQKSDLHRQHNNYIKLYKDACEYKDRHYRTHYVKVIRCGHVLKIHKLITLSKHGVTRIMLNNHHYITSNKNWVKLVNPRKKA